MLLRVLCVDADAPTTGEGGPGNVNFVPFNNAYSLPDFEACIGCIFVWQRLRDDSSTDPFMYVANDIDGIRTKFGTMCSTMPEVFSGVCGEMSTQSDLLIAKLLTNMSSVGLCGSAGYCWPELFAPTRFVHCDSLWSALTCSHVHVEVCVSVALDLVQIPTWECLIASKKVSTVQHSILFKLRRWTNKK